MTLDALIELYLDYARDYYRRPDGTATRHAVNLQLVLRPLRSDVAAEDFLLDDFVRYRDDLVKRGLKRPTINQWCRWVRGCFRWAARRGLVSTDLPARLSLLEPLRYGRGLAPEPNQDSLLTREAVLAAADVCPSPIAEMMKVQWLTGMRPGELVRMRVEEVVVFEGWTVYRPTKFKTAHFGLSRSIVLVPEAVELLPKRTSGYYFQHRRRTHYAVSSYANAVRRHCKKAGVPFVRPGRIRRSSATYARRTAGKEAAQRLLGHVSGDMTEQYFDLELIDTVQAAGQLVDAGWSLEKSK